MQVPLVRLPRLPGDLIGALQVLPAIARHTAAMRKSTGEMAEATRTLPEIRRSIRAVAKDTAALRGLEALATLETMDRRMANIEGAMPVLVDVQKDLTRVPDTLERLDGRLSELSAALERLLAALDALGDNVDGLHRAVGPLGRLAQRFPGGSGRAHDAG
jgi:hypothetical protein